MKNIATHAVPAWRRKANFIIRADLAMHGMPERLEQLWARKIDVYTFEICCIPFFTYGFTLGDIVETNAEYTIQKIVEKRGHISLRAAVTRLENQDEIHETLHAWVDSTGLLYEWFSPGYLSVDLPPDARRDDVISHLDSLVKSGEVAIEIVE